jgi:hypothetical protein
VLSIFLNQHIGHPRDVGLEAVVGRLRHDHSLVALFADALGIDVLLDSVLNRQLGQLLADVFPDFDQLRIARAVRAPAFGRADRMLDAATGQMIR